MANDGKKAKKDNTEESVEYNIERDEENKFLRCDFDVSERLELAEKLARAMYELEDKQTEFDSIKKQYNSEISALGENVKAKQRLVHDGYEFRPIPCQVERDYNAKRFTLTRLDTGEVIEERPLRPSELQRRMFSEKSHEEDFVEEELVNA